MEQKLPNWFNPEDARFSGELKDDRKLHFLFMKNLVGDTMTIRRHRRSTAEWEVRYTKFLKKHGGSSPPVFFFTAAQLASAFGISENPVNEPAWSKKFDLECGVQDVFARSGKCLNIPNPSVSLNSPLEISIFVTPSLQRLVAHLLS